MYKISNQDYNTLLLAGKYMKYEKGMTLKEENEVRKIRLTLRRLTKKKPL